MVLQDPDSFLLTIMGKTTETKVSVNDGGWHHVAVTWSSNTGSYASYQDGIKMNEGSGFQAKQVSARTLNSVFVICHFMIAV